MYIYPILLLPLFVGILSSAHACFPSPDTKPASITKKTQESTYVFDGIVTEITNTHLKIKVSQYFKGERSSEVKITYHKDQITRACCRFILTN